MTASISVRGSDAGERRFWNKMRAAHLHSLKRYSGREKEWEKPVIDGAGQPFEIRGIFFYQKAERAEWYDCSERGMEAMVIDFGALTQKNQDAFFRAAAVFWRFGQRMAAGRFCGIGSRKAKMEKMV